MTCRVRVLAAIVATLPVILSMAPADAQQPTMVGGAQMLENRKILENLSTSQAHTNFIAAVRAAGLVGPLSNAGPFTLFAPNNDGFSKLPPGTLETLLKPDHKPALARILYCHVVAGSVMSQSIEKTIADDKGTYPMKTMGGCVLQAKMADGRLTLTDENGTVAIVRTADIKEANGVLHVINAVMLPKK